MGPTFTKFIPATSLKPPAEVTGDTAQTQISQLSRPPNAHTNTTVVDVNFTRGPHIYGPIHILCHPLKMGFYDHI